jgi:endonuclease YncB( thermonuclease family)
VVWTVPARIRRVVDGDTVRVDLDLGWGIVLADEPIRLARINAPETSTQEGRDASAFLAEKLQSLTAAPEGVYACTFISKGFDKYRRALGELNAPNLGNIGDLMLASGHAVSYTGGD